MTIENSSDKPNLAQVASSLQLTLLTGVDDLESIYPEAGYVADLLSCVMTSATKQGIWITLQAHTNVVAVAALLDLAAVIITEGAMPEPPTIEKAKEEGVRLLSTTRSSFEVVGKLWELGFRAE